jgi:hypothetical protein
MSSVVTRRTKLCERPAVAEETCVAACESASPSSAKARRSSCPVTKYDHAVLAAASDAESGVSVPPRRFASLPITILQAPLARPARVASSNSENESPSNDDSVQRRAPLKRACAQVSAASGAAPGAAPAAAGSSHKPSRKSSASAVDASADFQSPKFKKKRDAAEASSIGAVAATSTLEQFGFPVVNFIPKTSDVEISDRSRDSTLALYGFSEPKFKPKVCNADAAVPLVQSGILKFCVNTDKTCVVNVEDSPEHCLASADGSTPPTACRKSSSAESQTSDAVSSNGDTAESACVLPAKRVSKPDSCPETLEEHRHLIYHQLRTPAMCHEDAATGKQVFRCAGHIVRHFATNSKGGLKLLAKKMGLDFSRLHDKSLFWRKREKPLFNSDITSVLRLGTVEGVRPCFAFDGFVYPIGFISRFVYTNFEDHHTDVYYQFGIVDCKLCPLFYMISETYDTARYYQVASSPAELWEAFEKFLHEKFDEPIREAAYEEIFGYGLSDVVAAIARDADGESLNFMVAYAVKLKDFTRTHTLQELDEDEWLDDSKHPFYLNSGAGAAPKELSAHQKAVLRSRHQKKPETDSEDDDPVELRVPAGEFLWHGKAGFFVEDITLKFRRPVLELFTGCKIKEQQVLDIDDLPTPEPEMLRRSSSKKKRPNPVAPPAPEKKLEFIRELPRVQAHALKIGAALPMNSSGSARTQPYVPLTFLQKLPFITIAEQHLPPELSSAIRYSKISDTERYDHRCRCTFFARNFNYFRYKLMRQHLNSTLAVGLSSIHGRGLFLLHPVMQHQMLIEYTGELIRFRLVPAITPLQTLIACHL